MLHALRSRTAATLAVIVATAGLVGVAGASPAVAAQATCRAPSGWRSVRAAAVPGSTYRHTLTSFDGTEINLNWFPNAAASATAPMPVVLMGPEIGRAHV